MKKILFVCDGDNFSQGAFDFIKSLRKNEHILVKGFFFTAIDVEQLVAVSYIPISESYVKLKEEEKRTLQKSKDKFIHQCKSAHIKYHIDDNNAGWDKELFIRESRFADLVVISEQLFCSDFMNEQPNLFMHEALRGSECPVMIIPETFTGFDRIVIAYDGKKESVFALKQFSYLLSQYTDLPTEFVYVKNEETGDIPDLDLLQEYACLQFNSLSVSKLHFDPSKYFTTWIEDKKNVLLVTGSFARSAVSSLVRKSFTDQVIHNNAIPVFIAHNA